MYEFPASRSRIVICMYFARSARITHYAMKAFLANRDIYPDICFLVDQDSLLLEAPGLEPYACDYYGRHAIV